MKILIIKLSSMGDVIHTLPAIYDAKKMQPSSTIDWLIDSSFAEIASWSKHVDNIYAIPLRSKKFRQVIKIIFVLRQQKYDLIIDLQGLLKSAILARCIGATCIVGFDKKSAREMLASMFYHKTAAVPKDWHAIDRLRLLLSFGLNYEPTPQFDYGVNWEEVSKSQDLPQLAAKFIVFLHGTTWESKCWPNKHWQRLASIYAEQGYQVVLTYANATQQQNAARIAENNTNVLVLPPVTITKMLAILLKATHVVAVDTGFGHLAAALQKSMVGLYGPTNPEQAGLYGSNAYNLCGPFSCLHCKKRKCQHKDFNNEGSVCMQQITPEDLRNF